MENKITKPTEEYTIACMDTVINERKYRKAEIDALHRDAETQEEEYIQKQIQENRIDHRSPLLSFCSQGALMLHLPSRGETASFRLRNIEYSGEITPERLAIRVYRACRNYKEFRDALNTIERNYPILCLSERYDEYALLNDPLEKTSSPLSLLCRVANFISYYIDLKERYTDEGIDEDTTVTLKAIVIVMGVECLDVNIKDVLSTFLPRLLPLESITKDLVRQTITNTAKLLSDISSKEDANEAGEKYLKH